MHYMKMQGKEVFKVAVPKMAQAAKIALKAANKTVADMDLLIPHQANLRIIEAVGKRLNLPADKVYVNVRQYGNMSAASTIVALDAARSEGKVTEGSLVCLAAFGGGFTWGAVVLQF
jgi:3-oxoacyl-[acyl-carrier-protein] synthase-3